MSNTDYIRNSELLKTNLVDWLIVGAFQMSRAVDVLYLRGGEDAIVTRVDAVIDTIALEVVTEFAKWAGASEALKKGASICFRTVHD